ncbi:MAG: HAD family hydrolase [Tissierellia bacterium]|nr:HAD family hydrolase [Tissierellia bacterium]
MKKKFAFFDFDRTLINRDSIFILWQRTLLDHPQARREFFRHFFPHLRRSLKAPNPSLAFKNQVLSLLNYYEEEDLRAFILEELLPTHAFKEGVEEVHRLKEAGYHLVLASASVEDYLVYVKEALPFDQVLGTRTRAGQVLEKNNRKEEKVRRIQDYLDQEGLEIDYEASRAYSDDYVADGPMLGLVKNRFIINRKLAPKGCHILHWSL